MKYLPLAIILLFSLDSRGQVAEPGADHLPWVAAVLAEKDYILEFAYGETLAHLSESGMDEFVRSAKNIGLGVAGNDAGVIDREGGGRTVYRLTNIKGRIVLEVLFSSPVISSPATGGMIQTTTRVVLSEGEWQMVSQLQREVSGIKNHYAIAARLRKRG